MFPARSAAFAALLGLAVPAAHAQSGSAASATFPFNAAAHAMNVVFANPPLPMPDNEKRTYKASILPNYFKGEMDRTEPFGTETGDFKGWGGGTSLSYGLGEKWGLYLLAMGASMTGDFKGVASTGGTVDVTNVEASYLMFSPALTYQFGAKSRWMAFFGPTVTRADGRETVKESNGSDYDLDVEKTMPGLLVGLQASFDLSESFEVSPFAILGGSFGSVQPKATVRTNSGGHLATILSGGTTEIGTGGANGGVFLTYKPWGLSMNVTAPILRKFPLFVEDVGKGVAISQFSLSWSFGTYPR